MIEAYRSATRVEPSNRVLDSKENHYRTNHTNEGYRGVQYHDPADTLRSLSVEDVEMIYPSKWFQQGQGRLC